MCALGIFPFVQIAVRPGDFSRNGTLVAIQQGMRFRVHPLVIPVSLLACAGVAFLPSRVPANEIHSAASRTTGFAIHDAAQTLREHCAWESGRLWLTLPGGNRWELVTSTDDPSISNPGDGAFHVFDAAEVRTALESVRFPLDQVSAEIYILPYPRRGGLESAAGPGLILLAPGVLPLSREHQHAEFVHELGHVVQYVLMPDRAALAWERYRALRGIADTAAYSAASPHRGRPHEIFAEDFRALYGDAQANYSGTIENPELTYPTEVSGLAGWILELASATFQPAHAAISAGPSPSRGAVTFSRGGSAGAVLELFDARGRRLAKLQPAIGTGAVLWSWNGCDPTGRPVRGSIVFARARDGAGDVARVVMLP